MHYRHPRIGFAFDLPPGWDLDSARVIGRGVRVILSLGETRLVLQIRRSQGNAATRLSLMTDHLKSVRATSISPCQAPPFGSSRDIVALSFHIGNTQQRWISVGQDGYDYTISHTDHWQDVAAAVDRLAGTFVFPAPTHMRRVLPDSVSEAPMTHAAHGTQWPAAGADPDWMEATALPPHQGLDPGYRVPASAWPEQASGLWQKFSARLRRTGRHQG
jgi:hypothetical protein